MSAVVLEQLCELAAEGRLSEAISLIRREIGAAELELASPSGQGQGDPEGSGFTRWTHRLTRQGRTVGTLRGAGPKDQALLEKYARLLALAIREPLPVLAQMALDAGTEAFWTLDLETGAFSFTDRLQRLAGDEGSHLSGPADVLRPEDRRRFQADLAQALGHQASSFEGVYLRRGDEPQGVLRFATRVVRDEAGEPTRLMGVVSDITESQEAQRRLELQRQELELRATLSREVAALVTQLIYADDAEAVEALGGRAFASLLGVEAAAFLRPVGEGWELRSPARRAARLLGTVQGTPAAPLLAGQEPLRLWETSQEHDSLSTELVVLGFPGAAAFALDAGGSLQGAVLALGKSAHRLGPQEQITGRQLAVTLAVVLARLEDRARLRSGQRQLEQALRLTRSGSWVYDARADRVQWSRALCELNGLPAAERLMTRQESVALTEPSDREAQSRAFAALLTRGGTETWMARVRMPDGRLQHRRNTAVAERSPQGALARISGVSSDVTAEVEAQAGLEQALSRARRYQTLFNLSETLSAIIDPRGHLVDASPTWHTTLGWDQAELARRSIFSFMHDEDRDSTIRLSTEAMAAGRSFSTTNRFRTRDGRWRMLSWNAVPDPDQHLVYAVAHDVTNLVETTERLERNEALLRRAGALAHVGGWEYDAASRTLVWNEETRRIHQVDAEFSPTLESWLQFFEEGTRPAMGQALRRCLEAGEAFDLELKLTTARRVEVWVRAQGQAERVNGRIARLFGAFQDITHQREAREAVLEASRAKSQFLANTSHEIRTPLNGILGMTQLALEDAVSAEQRENLEAVASSGRNLLAIVNDILDISKIESGRMELEAVPVVLDRLIHETVRSQAPRAQARGLELVALTDAALAEPVQGDPVRLGQILTNLVGNAIKFTEAGEVVVEGRATGDGLTLTVRDTGVGIPPSRLGAIFEAFTQGDGSTSRRFGGTGLGLTITRELATRMGGRIDVSSALGQGSTFRVWLPLRPRAALARARPLQPAVRVLAVLDHPAARGALCHALRELGAVPTAAGPDEALGLLAASREAGPAFELLLVDLALAGTSGLRLLEAVDALGLTALPRLLLTSAGQRVERAEAARLRIRRSLSRPVAPWELREVLETLDGPSPVEAPPSTPTPEPAPRRRLLLAEDNAINARLAVRLLEKLGHSVHHVTDGHQAVQAVLEERFDAVFMDMQMPHLDGLEATRRIRGLGVRGARLPIIALTANAMKGDDLLCLEAGMDAYLTKPIELERLREALERALRAHDPDRATARAG
jgi:two-component system, sensor histidine kinase and response regulator